MRRVIILIWTALVVLFLYLSQGYGYNRTDFALEIHRASTHCENVDYGYAHNNMHYILQECEYTTEYSTTTVKKAILLNLDELQWRRILGWKF